MVHFRDLEVDEWIFEGDASVDPQYQVYRDMRETVKGNWRTFNPRTNVLWLHHIISKIIDNQPKKAHSTMLFKGFEELADRLLKDYGNVKAILKDPFFRIKK